MDPEIKDLKVVNKEAVIHQEDMVTAVSGADTRFILTGSWDQLGRLWRDNMKCSHILKGHEEGITSATFFRPCGAEIDSSLYVATASNDTTLRFWKCDVDNSSLEREITCDKVLDAHLASINSVVANPASDKLCSGSCDSKLKFWQTRCSSETGDLEVNVVDPFLEHAETITSVVWPEDNFLYSASMDRSIKKWDIEKRTLVWNTKIEKSLISLDVGEGNLIAAGGLDNILRIWDSRESGEDSPKNSISYHTSWISSCKWRKDSSNYLLSASYDKRVMLWDMRITKSPVAIISSHNQPVLAVDWWKDDLIVSGGSDSRLYVSSVSPGLY